MPTEPITNEEVRNPKLSREDLTEAAREPLEDHSGSSWGAWGEDQIAQDDQDKPLMDVLSASGEGQRKTDQGAAESAPAQDVPSSLLNPTARDFRTETHNTEEARMASEPPQDGP